MILSKILKYIFLLISLPLLIYFLYSIFPTGFSSEKIRFVVNLEEDQASVVKRLKQENLIRSEKMFLFLLSMLKFPGKIEPGAYLLSHRMTTLSIVNTILYHPYQKWIIIVPGLRKEQTAEKLAEKFGWNKEKTDDFLTNAQEGYLFPDTYLLNVDYSGKEVAQRLISNFNEKFDAKLQNDLLAQNVRNDTAIKIASLIERESGGDEDKALIAGIIWNRLNKGMRLEIDATVQYALGKPGNWWPKISKADYKTVSDYNTYFIKTLPPTPICSPSLSSIKAVVYPAETNCLYYIHAPDKSIYCARTYEEHLENIKRYLR